ncbi:hypothetical protein PR048_000588 [Dryococelus australis]|uniref:Uncharacterized protein n=1 Tax=Dryococelus australis TaxID=614101 RepID=A0ABQ9IF22_9NEOP|nr:hypothetical protein PR048_000588 [Dryococelus australis]
MRVIEASMEQRWNERVGKMGDPRENPPTNGIVRHDSDMQKSEVSRQGIEPGSPWREASKLTGWRKQEILEKTRRLVASSGTIPTCENSGVTPPGVEPSSPRSETSSLTTTPRCSLKSIIRFRIYFKFFHEFCDLLKLKCSTARRGIAATTKCREGEGGGDRPRTEKPLYLVRKPITVIHISISPTLASLRLPAPSPLPGRGTYCHHISPSPLCARRRIRRRQSESTHTHRCNPRVFSPPSRRGCQRSGCVTTYLTTPPSPPFPFHDVLPLHTVPPQRLLQVRQPITPFRTRRSRRTARDTDCLNSRSLHSDPCEYLQSRVLRLTNWLTMAGKHYALSDRLQPVTERGGGASGHPDLGFPWFPEIAPAKCWVVHSCPVPTSLKLPPSLMTSLSTSEVKRFCRGKPEIPEKTRQPASLSGTIIACKNPGLTPPGKEPGSPWWEASRLTGHTSRPLFSINVDSDLCLFTW